MSHLAIVILNWNGRNWLQQFLPTVIKNSAGADVFVIDNASTDHSVNYLRQYFPAVHIICNSQNYGFAGGYNEGLKKIKADIYCLLNSDVEVTENWLLPVLKLFERDENIAAIQPKILDYNTPTTFEYAGAAGGLIDNLGYPYCRGRVFEDTDTDHGQFNDETEIFWASGCCLFVRSSAFWEVNGFDERFFAHQEEIDLCWRLKNKGYKIWYTGFSAVYHVGGGTLNKQSSMKTYLNIRNNLTMLLKNLPLTQLLWVLPARMILDGFAAFYFLIRQGPAHFWAVLRAHFSFYTHIPGTLKRRQNRQISTYFQSKWVIFRHFTK